MVNLFSELDDSPNYEREKERERNVGGGGMNGLQEEIFAFQKYSDIFLSSNR